MCVTACHDHFCLHSLRHWSSIQLLSCSSWSIKSSFLTSVTSTAESSRVAVVEVAVSEMTIGGGFDQESRPGTDSHDSCSTPAEGTALACVLLLESF